MSNDAKNQGRPQGRPQDQVRPQERTPERVDLASTAATATLIPPASTIPDPYEDPVGYLKSRGWKPLGNPSWSSCRWKDPLKPRKGYFTKQPILAANADGEMEQVMVPDGFGKTRPGERPVYHPPGEPVSMQEALGTQLDRDLAEQEEQG